MARFTVSHQVLLTAYITKSVRWTRSHCVPSVTQRGKLSTQNCRGLGGGPQKRAGAIRTPLLNNIKAFLPEASISTNGSFFFSFISPPSRLSMQGYTKSGGRKKKFFKDSFGAFKSYQKQEEGKGHRLPASTSIPSLLPPNLLCFKSKQTFSVKGSLGNYPRLCGPLGLQYKDSTPKLATDQQPHANWLALFQ